MPTSKPNSSKDCEDLNRFVTFTGMISDDDVVLPIKFRVRFGVDGELRFRVYPIPMTTEAISLSAKLTLPKSNIAATYKISAVSAAGTRFESESILITGSSRKVTQTSSRVILRIAYAKVVFTRTKDESDAQLAVRWVLRGFEAFPAIRGECLLGKVVLQGGYPETRPGRVSGQATIIAKEPVADSSAWLADAERLFHHLRIVMSMAMSRQIDCPIRDAWFDGGWERVAYSKTSSRRTYPHTFNPMALQSILDAAIASHFDPPIAAKGLNYTIEWLTMPVSHSEMKLTNVITALEHLTGENLDANDQVFLPKAEFKKFSKRLRQFASDHLAENFSDVSAQLNATIDEMRETFPTKMQDLNRRPLIGRIMFLADRWHVPLDGLDVTAVREAITARNRIVHRGYYYEPKAGSSEQIDLLDHVLMMREVAIRFVLTLIGYRGTYLSFRGGQHDVEFPPTSDNNSARLSSSVCGIDVE